MLDSSVQTDFLQHESDLNLDETHDATAEEATDDKAAAAPDTTVEDDAFEATQVIKNTGDIAIITYYGGMLGAVAFVVFILGMLVGSITDKLPSESN